MKKLLVVLGFMFLGVVVFFGGLLVWGGVEGAKQRPSVEGFINKFYAADAEGNYRQIWESMTSREFRDSGSYEDFEKLLSGIREKLGELESKSEDKWTITRSIGAVYYNIDYKTVRKKGKTLESFVLKKEGKGPWLLTGYNVNSSALLQ